MPYDWLTGKPVATLPGYGPRQPQTVIPGMTSHTVIPTFHTFTPAKGGWKLPAGTTLGYTPLKGYYAKPGGGVAAPAAAKPAAGGAPTIDSLIKQLYGSVETPAQQEARINREVNAQIGAQQKMIDDMYARQRADALRTMQAQSLAGQAAAAMNKDLLGSVGGEFNAAASEIKGLAHGLSKNAAGATAGDVSAANAGLASLGNAPVAEGGTFGVGGSTQQGVEEYRGGTLAQQMFGTQGEAAQFGLAGLIGSQGLRATQEAEAELHTTLADLRGKESDAINALASGRLDLYHQYKQDAADARVKSLTLIQGLIAQKQANAQATAKMQAQYARDALAQANRDRKFGLDVTKAKVSAAATVARVKQGAQRIQQGDARIAISQAQLTIAQQKEMRAALKDAVASGQVDVNRSKALKYVVDKTGKPILDANGKQIPSSLLATSTKKGPSAATMTTAQNKIEEWFYGTKTPTGATTARAANKVPGFDPNKPDTWGQNQISYVEAMKRLTRLKIPRTQARNMLNEYWDRGDGGRPILSSEERNAARKVYGAHRLDRILMTIRTLMDSGDDKQFQQSQLILQHLLAGQPIQIR